jgi:hypothetical protein
MSVIWKFPLPGPGNVMVAMPKGANVIHVGHQLVASPGGYETTFVMAWAEVDPSAEREPRYFSVLMTGEQAPVGGKHLGTIQAEWLVLHVYEVTS